MNEIGFLELAVSLCVQACVVIGACGWLVRQSASLDAGHRLWGTCHVMLLAQTAAALLLPHLRLLPHSMISDHVPIPAVATTEIWLGRILIGVWGVGAAMYAVGLVCGVLGVRRLIATADPLARPLDSESDDVTLLVSPRVSAPFCWQFHQPLIVLPESAQTFPAEELQAIIRHERAHLQSAHPVFLFLQRLVEMLYWFHPLVWWASRQADLHREFHCDREASRSRSETANYLRSLLRLSEVVTEPARRLPAGLGFHGARTNIKLRVERLLNECPPNPHDRRRTLLRVGVVAVVAAVSTGLWLPINVCASSRSAWSPWPAWSARALYEFGIPARDYEVDGHRLQIHEVEER
ncbi:MAG: M56 family metallopeptidase [Planctomycetaceae bacterium]